MKFWQIFGIILTILNVSAEAEGTSLVFKCNDGKTFKTNTIDLSKESEFVFTPDVTDELVSGCLGIETAEGFQCQTLYEDISLKQYNRFRLYNGPGGKLVQVQLEVGSGHEIINPDYVQPPVLKRAFGAAKQPSNEESVSSKGKTWKERKAETYEPESDDEQSFLQKYWVYLLPVGVILFTTAARGPPQQ